MLSYDCLLVVQTYNVHLRDSVTFNTERRERHEKDRIAASLW